MKNATSKIYDYFHNLDQKGWFLIGTSLFFTFSIYLYRAQNDEFWMMGYAAAFICIFSLPLLLGLLIWFIAYSFLTFRYLFQSEASRRIIIFPTLLIVFAFALPVPRLREHSLYLSHQDEYVALVQLALSGQLSHGGDCQADDTFAPPSGFEELTGDCIFFSEHYGIVEFIPISFYVSLSYAENPEDISNSSWCNWDGFIWKEIDSHWYICKRDFN